jgi:hypothetical protein
MNIFSDKVKVQKLVDTDMAWQTLVTINRLIKIGTVFYYLLPFGYILRLKVKKIGRMSRSEARKSLKQR